jgi:hypothetical protein
VRRHDILIVSRSRSGNAWIGFLIANLLCPRVIKSHQYLDHRYPKVLYTTRDSREVALALLQLFSQVQQHHQRNSDPSSSKSTITNALITKFLKIGICPVTARGRVTS